jgi:hypothetical protein
VGPDNYLLVLEYVPLAAAKRLPGNAWKRKKVIQSIVLIHNFRTELAGLNQISMVFDPEYKRYINLSSYDRIKRFYFQDDDVDN